MISLWEVLGSHSEGLGAELSGLWAMEKAPLSSKIDMMQKGENVGKKCVGSCNHLSTLATGGYPSFRIIATYIGTN